ncbi:MAG: hypothetical protein ACP5H8_02340 [Candidatus Micrarchaeia archaeon]
MIPFVREKPTMLLLLLKDGTKKWYISLLSKSTGMTYLHTLNVLNQLNNLGIVEYKIEGRKKMVVLTEKGKNAVFHLSQLIDSLKE